MFEFLKGKILVQLNKFNFAPGEVVDGTVTLKLKKPIKAKQLVVELYAVRKSTSGYGKNRQSNTETIFRFEQPLDGEKDYAPGQSQPYQFKITIPQNINTQVPQLPGGAVGGILKAAMAFKNMSNNVRWYVKAYLDIPWGIDMKKKVQINVAQIAQPVQQAPQQGQIQN